MANASRHTIDRAIAIIACSRPSGRVSAVDAAAELDCRTDGQGVHIESPR
jgi:hypothetical protein